MIIAFNMWQQRVAGGNTAVMSGSWAGGAGGFWMLLFALLFLALLVAGLLLIARSSSDGGRGRGGQEGDRARQILDERFARGDIDQAEYEERRSILSGGR